MENKRQYFRQVADHASIHSSSNLPLFMLVAKEANTGSSYLSRYRTTGNKSENCMLILENKRPYPMKESRSH